MNSAYAILLPDLARTSPLRDVCDDLLQLLARMTDFFRNTNGPAFPDADDVDDFDLGASIAPGAGDFDDADADSDPADASAPLLHAQADAAEEEQSVLAAIQRVLEGQTEAFAVILHTYERLVASTLAHRLPAQDVQEVAQDTFLRVFRSLPSFRHDAPVRTWVLRIARLAAMDHWRRHYRRRDVVMSDFDEAASVGVEHAAQAVQDQLDDDTRRREDARALLSAAMDMLSPDDRAVLTLVELENVPMSVAAEQLGCGISAVKVRAFRARKRLKRHVEDILARENA